MDWRAIGSSLTQSLQHVARTVSRIYGAVVRTVQEAVSPSGCRGSAETLYRAAQDYARIIGAHPAQISNPYFYPMATQEVMGRMSPQEQARLVTQGILLAAPLWTPGLVLRGVALAAGLWTASNPVLISPAGTHRLCR